MVLEGVYIVNIVKNYLDNTYTVLFSNNKKYIINQNQMDILTSKYNQMQK